MEVRLVSYSKASEFQTYEDGPLLSVQDLIAYCAKVSNPNNQINRETHERLLNYLVKHKHWSPFEWQVPVWKSRPQGILHIK